MRKLKKQLQEWSGFNIPDVGPIGGVPAADDVEIGVHNLELPQSLDSLNAFVGAIADKPYMNPYYAINRLWAKLQTIGLNFDLNKISFITQSGMIELPLTQFGGRYGFVDMDGHVKQDDGISHRIPGGLALLLAWYKRGGATHLEAKVVKTPAQLFSQGQIAELPNL